MATILKFFYLTLCSNSSNNMPISICSYNITTISSSIVTILKFLYSAINDFNYNRHYKPPKI